MHVSQLSHKFTTDAREVVKTGQIVKVKVMEVDVARKRIALSMKLDAAPARKDSPRDNRFEAAGRGQRDPRDPRDPRASGGGGYTQAAQERAAQGSAMADAFSKLPGLRK